MSILELERMRCEWVNVTRKNGFREGITDLLAHQYSKKTHFIFELLQNAEDAGATEVEFRVESHRLVFSHNGARLFSDENVESITSIGKSTKQTDYTKIGKHGIGFKAVFAYTHTPRIHSGDKHFDIEDVVIPCFLPDSDVPTDLKPLETRIILPFDSDAIPKDKRFRKLVPAETAITDISGALKKLSIRTLLFLRHIEEIRWTSVDGSEGTYLQESRSDTERESLRHLVVTDKDRTESWCVFERKTKVTDDGNDIMCIVEVAFLVKNGKVAPARDTELVVYFPTEKKTGMSFLIQGPFKTTKARDNIKSDDTANQQMLEAAARLAADSLEILRDLKLLEVSSYLALPLRKSEDRFFHPIYEKIWDTLRIKVLLPANDGVFIKAQEAKLSRGKELIELFSPERLCLLFGNENLSWLDASITENGTMANLHTYLVGRKERRNYYGSVLEVGIEPLWEGLLVDAATVISQLTENFLQEQSEKWLILFYRFIGSRDALWNSLRKKPFIRLEDGSHVKPFRNNGSPNAYLVEETNIETTLPVVKLKLTQNKEVYKFLKDLGIPDLDLVEEVIEKTLPKYKTDSPIVSINEHNLDLSKIKRAYATDSQEKKERLCKQLRSTSFIHADNPLQPTVTYRRPNSTYFSNDDLQTYFADNENAWFVKQDYDQTTLELFKKLGVADSVRVEHKQGNYQGYVSICSQHGWHQRGLNGFDPDINIDGFKYAITHSTAKKSLFIWNNIAVPHAMCIRGIVERSTRQTYEDSRKEDRVSEFGQLLIDTAWLPNPKGGGLVRPSELTLDELPKAFIRVESLAHQLGMKRDVVAKLAEEIGVSLDTIEKAKKFAEAPPEIKEQIDRLLSNSNEKQLKFPQKTSSDDDRRREKITKKYYKAPKKKYEKKPQSKEVTKNTIDPKNWLREIYTNKERQMICQICQDKMPFKKKDTQYYFEAIELLNDFDRKMEELYIALCPLCSAMYNEFVKLDEDAMESLKNTLASSEEAEIPLQLGELSTSLRFVETHFHDIKTILEEAREQ